VCTDYFDRLQRAQPLWIAFACFRKFDNQLGDGSRCDQPILAYARPPRNAADIFAMSCGSNECCQENRRLAPKAWPKWTYGPHGEPMLVFWPETCLSEGDASSG
jgi:hypothetical protein